ENPRPLATTASGWNIQAIGYSSSLEVKMEAQAAEKDGVPAAHVTLSTAMMGQKLDQWLFADESHDTFDLGLASISFKKGTAPNLTPGTAEAVDIEESIFSFANSPADQVAKTLKGGSTGAKIKLADVTQGNDGKLIVQLHGNEQTFDVVTNLGKTVPVPNSPYELAIDQYWPDFRIKDGKPMSLTNEPNNPCVLVTLRGHAVPAATQSEGNAKNAVTIFTDDKGAMTYQLSSRKNGVSTGKLELGKPLTTGWADWQLLVDQTLSRAEQHFVARPATNGKSEGVLIRAIHADKTIEQ